MLQILFLLQSLFFCRVSVALYHKMWNPIFVFHFMMMLGVLFVRNGNGVDVSQASFNNGLVWLITGSILLSVSFIIAQHYKRKKRYTVNIVYNSKYLSKLTTISLVVSTILLLLSTYEVMKIAGDFYRIFLESTAVRTEYLNREGSGGLLTYLNLFLSINHLCLLCIFPLAIQNKCKHVKTKLVLLLLICLMSSIITMSKDSFIFVCILLISSYSLQNNNIKQERQFLKRYSIIFIVLVVVLLVTVSFQRNYTASRYDNYFDAVTGTISGYIAVPISAFSLQITRPSISTMGEQCFRPFYNILSKFGIGERITIFQEAVEDNANVYTIFGNMYNDYGFPGIILMSILFGLVLGLIFNNKASKKLSGIVINSIILATMFFGFWDFRLIQTVYPFSMLYVLLLDYYLRKKLYVHT